MVKYLTESVKDWFETEEEYLEHAKNVVENIFRDNVPEY